MPPCGLTPWRSVNPTLHWHECSLPKPLAVEATLDEHLSFLRPRLTRDQSYKVGKLPRKALRQLLEAVRAEARLLHHGASAPSAAPVSAAALLNCSLTWSHAQSRDDLFLLPLLLHAQRASLESLATPGRLLASPGRSGQRRRSFVELGALDGVAMSNTHMLEYCWRWSGLLIEADPYNCMCSVTRIGRARALQPPSPCSRSHTPPPPHALA